MEAEQVVDLRGVGLLTLLCPEVNDPSNRRNWSPARNHPEVRMSLKGPRGTEKLDRLSPESLSELTAPPIPKKEEIEEGIPEAEAPVPLAIVLFKAACVGLLILFGMYAWEARGRLRTAFVPPKPRSLKKRTISESVRGMSMPACGKTLSQMAGGAPTEFSETSDGDYRVRLVSEGFASGEEIVLEYDPDKEEVLPLNIHAQRLMDFRSSCP